MCVCCRFYLSKLNCVNLQSLLQVCAQTIKVAVGCLLKGAVSHVFSNMNILNTSLTNSNC